MTLLLIDKSAYVRGSADVSDGDELCLCVVTRLELLYSARSRRGYQRLEDDLTLFRDLCMRRSRRQAGSGPCAVAT